MLRRTIIGIGVGLLLADVAIVTLALPDLLVALRTSVVGVASVLFAYLAVLTAGVPVGIRLRHRIDAPTLAAAGFLLASGGALLAATADNLGVLLAARATAAAGAGVAVVGGFELIGDTGRGRQIWRLATGAGAALGPALGGALAQAFGWRAIFTLQVPVLMLAAVACVGARPVPTAMAVAPARPARRSRGTAYMAALGLMSAAVSVALFALVLVLIAGWDVSPLAAAAAVSALPLAALAGARATGSPGTRAAVGCALVGAGALALAWIPRASLAWTIIPQLVAGAGVGIALPALAGGLLPERTATQAGRLLSVRHGAIALLLIAVAPVIAGRLPSSTRTAELQGIGLVLDAKLSPQAKLSLAPRLYTAIRAQDARDSLSAAFARNRHDFTGADLAAYDQLDARTQTVLVAAVQGSFQPAFIASGVLGLLAALVVLAAAGRPRLGRRAGLVATAVIVLVPAAYAVAQRAVGPAAVTIANPCDGGSLPHSGGITGFLQDRALQLLDDAACHLHTTREELVLAVASPAEARRFAAAHHGVDPHSLLDGFERLIGRL